MRLLHRHYVVDNPRLRQELWGIRFSNPIGIAAGFDKNGRLMHVLPSLGFGFLEIGTITSEAQKGNPKPRLFRLPKDSGLINRLGFNNDGANVIARRLASESPPVIPLGINIGKARRIPLAEAAADYAHTFETLWPQGSYFVANVSSPNTPGLRTLQLSGTLAKLIDSLQTKNAEMATAARCGPKPLLIKISPDLTSDELDAVADVATSHRIDGIIATNTTTTRIGITSSVVEDGGLSGAPLRERSTEVIRHLFARTQGRVTLIGVGGVFDATHAWDKIRSGASLIQIYTGLIYGGPATASRIASGLLRLMDAAGIAHISEAVGSHA